MSEILVHVHMACELRWWWGNRRGPCHGSECQSPGSHRGIPGSVPGSSVWDLWDTKRGWDRIFSEFGLVLFCSYHFTDAPYSFHHRRCNIGSCQRHILARCNKSTYFKQNTLIFLLLSADFGLCCHWTNFSLLQNTYNSSGTGPNLLFNEFRRSFPGLKWPGRDVDHSPPSVPEIKSKRTSTPACLTFLLLVDGDKFAFLPLLWTVHCSSSLLRIQSFPVLY